VVECTPPLFRNYISLSCDPCVQLYLSDDQSCHQSCPPFTFQSSSTECARCRPPCAKCAGVAACLSCEKGLLLGQQCLADCPSRHYASAGECRICSANCDSCNQLGCLVCAPGHFL
jgi:hypothetical protein